MDKKEFIFPGAILGVVIIIAVALVVSHSRQPALIPDAGGLATSTTSGTATTTSTSISTTTHSGTSSEPQAYYPYGQVPLVIGQAAGFKDGLSIRPTAIVEDSRCPLGVFCIQAGTARVSVKINVGGKESVQTIKLDESITAGGDTIEFTSLQPIRRRDVTIAQSDYRLIFTVTRGTTPVVTAKPCYVGGCSSEICSDSSGQASSCIYRSEYACYKTATCERQTNGSCGWTQTSELKACLANPPGLQ